MNSYFKVRVSSSFVSLKSITTILLFFVFLNGFSNDTLIWRSIPIKSGGAVTLGSSIEKLSDVTIFDSKKNYHLKIGTFGGADSITIKTDGKNLIKSVSFFYALTKMN